MASQYYFQKLQNRFYCFTRNLAIIKRKIIRMQRTRVRNGKKIYENRRRKFRVLHTGGLRSIRSLIFSWWLLAYLTTTGAKYPWNVHHNKYRFSSLRCLVIGSVTATSVYPDSEMAHIYLGNKWDLFDCNFVKKRFQGWDIFCKP